MFSKISSAIKTNYASITGGSREKMETSRRNSPGGGTSGYGGDNYDLTVDPTGTSDFSYEEFDGKDGRTCPTCQGTGRIPKAQEEELVALIPYNDQRLKPPKTKLYVIFAVVICLVTSGLIVFFLFPRAVAIQEDRIVNFTVLINETIPDTNITIVNRFNISNTNFFGVRVTEIVVQAFFDQVLVGTGRLQPKNLQVGSRETQFPVDITIKTRFYPDNQLDFVGSLCTDSKRKVHDIVIKLQATQTVWYLEHKEQNAITAYKYIDCSVNTVFH